MEKTLDVRHIDTDLMHYRLGWLAVIGLGLILTGMTALYAPYYSNFSLRTLIGSFFLAGGAMFVAHAIWSPREWRFAQEVLIGLLYLFFAMLIWGFAGHNGETLILFLSFFFGLEGIQKIFFSLRLRPQLEWTWALISGVVSLIMGAAIWGIPPGAPLVSVMVGIDMLHGGLTTIMIAHAMRKTLEKREMLCVGGICFSE